MPTYQNRTGEKVFINNTSFSPGETKVIPYYLNLDEVSGIVKVSDDPNISKPFRSIFLNSGPSDFSKLMTMEHSLFIKVTDGNLIPSLGAVAIIGLFVGNTDDVIDFSLVKKYEFQKETHGSYSYWYSKDSTLIPRQSIDSTLEFICFRILSVSSGSINLLQKYY